MEFHVEVAPEDRGAVALEIVSSHLQDFLEHFLKRLFHEGHVRCGPRAIKPDQILPPGACLVIDVPDGMMPNISPKPHPLSILVEDPDLLVVDKPAGLSMFPGLGFEPVTLFEAVWFYLKGSGDRPRIVNRIDKGTTGVVLFARNRDAQSHLAGQFQRREVDKTYFGLVTGRVKDDSGEIQLPLAPHATRPEMMVVDTKHGKDALTRYTVRERFGRFTYLELKPLTGRTHQIRAHLRAIGHSLAVDPVYGSSDPILLSGFKRGYRHKGEGEEERPLLARTPLHAMELGFRHPKDNQLLKVVAPMPKDMEVTLKQLRKWDPNR
jgi:23S rRNA pseudouridine1911/1915/1917 synthase